MLGIIKTLWIQFKMCNGIATVLIKTHSIHFNYNSLDPVQLKLTGSSSIKSHWIQFKICNEIETATVRVLFMCRLISIPVSSINCKIIPNMCNYKTVETSSIGKSNVYMQRNRNGLWRRWRLFCAGAPYVSLDLSQSPTSFAALLHTAQFFTEL